MQSWTASKTMLFYVLKRNKLNELYFFIHADITMKDMMLGLPWCDFREKMHLRRIIFYRMFCRISFKQKDVLLLT